jgi:hypothetical protein
MKIHKKKFWQRGVIKSEGERNKSYYKLSNNKTWSKSRKRKDML